MLLNDARKLGDDSCTTCTEKAGIAKGLRAEVKGTVKTIDPPVLDITSVKFLMDGDMGCQDMAMDDGGSSSTEPPAEAEAPVADPIAESDGPAETPATDPSAAVQIPALFVAAVSVIFSTMI